jgi:hypothetical protein
MDFLNKWRIGIQSLLIFAGVLLYVNGASAQNAGLVVTPYVQLWGGCCQPGYMNVIAGSSLMVELFTGADTSLESLQQGWPAGYALEAALDKPSGRIFVATPGLIERLTPVPFHRTGIDRKCFFLHIPEDLAGHSLTLVGTFRKGTIYAKTSYYEAINVVLPCDSSDFARVIGTRVFEARMLRNYNRGMMLVDSMLSLNLTDVIAFNNAVLCACGSERYARAAKYLEYLYTDYGVLDLEWISKRPVPLDRSGQRNQELQERYDRARNGLLKSEIQHQQQQR